MLRATNPTRFWVRKRTSHHPVKLTALTYLREALLDGRYEECAFAIEVAKEFGAQEFEVQNLLEDPRRKP
ncbi:MAG: hypothetical protein A3C35_02595 [Omnitrophica bacterium RIFCSPHIGHO2_02_FULL_46_11]|nr:MAG: hypothetical protein A3C35_02595 [Omnitrophica bacterium RIFCSPHIGHO2_02_FULL_46_11]OGW87886.1 MAG: hypothetical protein A3A81_05600 [Omnitrophica bacterium RIFCSPLOWO2_01_FULL_45_10b]